MTLNSNIKIESIKRVVVYCLSHEKSRRSFSYYMNFLNELDLSLYERKDFNGLDSDGILTLYNICNQILGESEIWDEYSIITGESLDELRNFRNLLYKIITDT